MRASVDSVPQITMSNPPSLITFARTFEVASASVPASASSEIKIASSTPMESALRNASLARSGPIEITVMVWPLPSPLSPVGELPSTRARADSIAYSSRSLRTASTLARSNLPSGPIVFCAHESGTCLMQTAIFMALCYS